MKGIKRAGGLLLAAALVFAATGCGQGQKDDKAVTKIQDTGETEDAVSMEKQLKVMAEHSNQWLKGEDKSKPYRTYAVTDLDQNGRWELIVSEDRQGSGQFSYTDYFQVNAAGDGLEKIKTGYKDGDSEADVAGDLGTAYYDPEKNQYHYITGDFATAGAATGYYKSVETLTLCGDEIQWDLLGYELRESNEKGKLASKYVKIDAGKEKKIDKEEFSRELLGDAYYPECGKLNTNIAWFQFENKLKNATEDMLLYYLRRSAKGFSLGCPLVQQTRTIHGLEVKVPQYICMTDEEKQEKLNKLIAEEVGKSLEKAKTSELGDFACRIKWNDPHNLSILTEGSLMAEDAAHPYNWADTININCDKMSVLGQTDIITKDEREWVEEDIMEGDCEDIRDVGYRSYQKKNGDGKLLPSGCTWKDVKVYQTEEKIGVVIPTIYAMGSYQIYEIRKDDFPLGVDYDQVDWEAYQYKLSASDYKALQRYMPVLKGEKTFFWNKDRTESVQTVEVTMPQYFQEMSKEAELKHVTFSLDNITLCDVTQDGEKELILSFHTLGYFSLLLHQEGDRFYGIYRHIRCLKGLTENGIFSASGGSVSYYQMRFADGQFKETYLGGYERPEKGKFFIGKREVKEKEFEKWKKKTLGKEVPEYEPFAKEL